MEVLDNVKHSAEQRDHDQRGLKQHAVEADANAVPKDGHSDDGLSPSSLADASATKRYGLRKKRAGGSVTPSSLQFTSAEDKENESRETKERAPIRNGQGKKKAPLAEKNEQDDPAFKEAEQEEEQQEKDDEEWTPKRVKKGKREVVLSYGKEKVNGGESENIEEAPAIESKSAKKETKRPSKKDDEKLILSERKDEKSDKKEFIYTTLDLDDLAPAALLRSEPVVGKVNLIREASSAAKPIRKVNLDPDCEDVVIDESTPNNSPVKLASDSNAMGNIS